MEILEPAGRDGFLARFLETRGAGIHHVTFRVPSLADACARARARGYDIVGRDESDPEWKEAFLHPKQALGIVVQFAETTWTGGDGGPAHWTPPPGPRNPPAPVRIVGLRMKARSPERARRQWEEILRGKCSERNDQLIYRWPGAPLQLAIEIDPAAEEGPCAIEYSSDLVLKLPDGRHPVLGVVFARAQRLSVDG